MPSANLSELEPIRQNPGRSALLLDVDGTLAPIAETPERASVPEAARSLLGTLAQRYGLVACVSGRRALNVRGMVGLDSLTYSGNHGLEYLAPCAREPQIDPSLTELESQAGQFAREHFSSELERAGVRLEDKHTIWAFHWRGAPNEVGARALLEQVAVAAGNQGLKAHWGRKVLEIRPDVAANKGTAIQTLLEHASVEHALYAGDDTTDLDAFAMLRKLRHKGRLDTAVCVGVRSDEGPAEIEKESDLVVAGPAGLVELLSHL